MGTRICLFDLGKIALSCELIILAFFIDELLVNCYGVVGWASNEHLNGILSRHARLEGPGMV